MTKTIHSSLCKACFTCGFCQKEKNYLVTDEEIQNPEFIRDVRNFAYSLQKTRNEWFDFLIDLYRDYQGRLFDQNNQEIIIEDEDFETFESKSIRYWFRDFCCTLCPDDLTPRVKNTAKERVRILATLLRAHNPHTALFWGLKGRSANDNHPKRP